MGFVLGVWVEGQGMAVWGKGLGGGCWGLEGSLAHKKATPPLTPSLGPFA